MLNPGGAEGRVPARLDFEAAKKRLTGQRALVLDDDSHSFGGMFVSLAKAGCAAVLARRWAQVEPAIHRHEPTIIIFSTQLVEVGPAEIIQRLRHTPATAQRILVATAGQESKKERRRLLLLGCDGYVWKPADRYLFATDLVARTPALYQIKVDGRPG